MEWFLIIQVLEFGASLVGLALVVYANWLAYRSLRRINAIEAEMDLLLAALRGDEMEHEKLMRLLGMDHHS